MSKTTKTWFNRHRWHVMYIFAGANCFLYGWTEKSLWGLAGVITVAIIWIVHDGWKAKRKELVQWGNLKLPFYVVDWGPEEREIEIPDHHKGTFILCPASEVQRVLKEVNKNLAEAENRFYTGPDKQLTVEAIYFRWGSRATETAEQYQAYVVDKMDKALIDWHQRYLGADREQYRRDFFDENQNGSLFA